MGGMINAIDEAIEYIDNELFDKHITDIQEASSNLKLNDGVFASEDSVVGTEALVELSKQLQEVFLVSNSYKTHMHGGIIPLLQNAKQCINDAAEESGVAANGLLYGLGFSLDTLSKGKAKFISNLKSAEEQLDQRGRDNYQSVISLLQTGDKERIFSAEMLHKAVCILFS